MGGISQDVKRLRKWDFYPLYFGFFYPLCEALVLLTWPGGARGEVEPCSLCSGEGAEAQGVIV